MLSVNYYNLGQFEKAERYGKEAVERKTDFLKAWLNLGSVYRSQAKLDEALRCYQKANQLDPKNAGVAFRIGEIYRDQGDLGQALKLFDITLKIEKDHKRAILEKADIYKKKGNYKKAHKWISEAKDMYSDLTPIEISEAELYKSEGDYDRAIQLYEKLLKEKPDYGALRVNYALCLQEVSRFEESEKHYRRAIEDTNSNLAAISNYLMGLHYNPKNNREHIFKEHLRLGKKFISQDNIVRALPDSKAGNKRLKIGFVSGGFRSHPVGWMISGALEQLSEDHFEIYCYTTNNKFDFVTRRIHQNIEVWRSVVGYSSKIIERIIREDELDILVDLSGHSAENCLEVMAHEPAPIIVKWVGGLFNTTGLKAFDYLISDWHESPEGEEPFYTEKLVRLPDDYITFTPPAYAPEVGELPAKKNEYITFGCFNNPTKVNEVVLKQWAEIMHQVPQSRLYLKSKQYDTASFRKQILEVMKEEDIAEDRIEFEGHTSHDDHLGAYNKVDIALDPWPYSGGLTTCEALYMGVPVITMPGPTFAGRHSTTHLINAGLEQWVVDSWDDYTRKAIGLTSNLEELKEWRFKLRNQLLNSPVCDGKRFGAHLSVAFQKMWEQWVDGYENEVEEWQDHIEIEPLPQEMIEKLTDGPDTTPLITIKDEDNTNSVLGEESNKTPSEDIQQPIAAEEMITKTPANGQQVTKDLNGQQNKTYYIETKDGVTVCTPSDLKMLTPYVLLEQEQWLEPELDFIRQYLQPGMQVVDVGGSFGAYALPMAKKVGGEGAVYAFEPSAIASQYLEMSKSENGFTQLEIIKRGLGQEIGKGKLKIAESPEFNTIDKDGEEDVSITTLDAWWNFAGKPEIHIMKIDVNGMEAEMLQGAAKTLETAEPIILASIGENKESLAVLREQLTSMGYVLFEYIPGPGVLSGHDPEAGVDPYTMNIVAIKESRINEFKEAGWIFDETATPENPESTLWKEILSTLPWTDSLMEGWKEKVASGDHEEYMLALTMICAAEQMEVSAGDAQSQSRKGATMLAAAQKLIGLFNSGQAGISAAMTYVRVMNQLGKRTQAVEMMKELMETVNSGKDISVELPFLPPLQEQDEADIQTDFPKWLTVRIVEAWIMLKNPSTYMSGEQEKQMLKALEGNPELNSELWKSIRLSNEENEEVLDIKRNQWFWSASDSKELSTISVTSNGHSTTVNGLKHLYLGYPGKKGGAHGIHEIRTRKVAQEIEKKGIQTSLISSSGPEFLDALSKVKDNDGYACYSGVMGYDLKVHADMGVSGNIFDLLDIPVFAFLGDHPYTDFMWSRIVNSADRTVFLTSIPSLKEEMEQIFPNTAVKQIGNLFPLSVQNGDLKSIGSRPVDVLVPWGLHKFFGNQESLAQQLQAIGRRQKDLGMALYNEAVGNYRTSILTIFTELYQAEFGGQYPFGNTKTKEDFRWLRVLSLVDWMIRKDRRIKMLREQLSFLPEKYRAVITANEKLAEVIPELKGKNNIEWVGQISKQKLNQFYRNSKVVFNCNPTYLDNIHPRVYEGISNGSFVISDFNEALETTLFGQDAIGIVDQKSNEKNLVDYLEEDWKDLQEKVDRGCEIIGAEFTAENHAQSIIEVITEEMK
nr:FkbM family methyltransferase [Fodinibius salicampi]